MYAATVSSSTTYRTRVATSAVGCASVTNSRLPEEITLITVRPARPCNRLSLCRHKAARLLGPRARPRTRYVGCACCGCQPRDRGRERPGRPIYGVCSCSGSLCCCWLFCCWLLLFG